MPKRNQRQKASDVFREAQFLFARKGTFAEAYPTISKLKVEVEEQGRGVNAFYGPSVYTEENAGEYVDCSNPLCYNGGLHLGDILRAMVRENQTDREVAKLCQGYNGSPKGRRNYGPCVNSFRVKVHVDYRMGDHGRSAPKDDRAIKS